jgi:TIR domain
MSPQATAPARQPAVRLFVSYSHKDDYWMQALMPLLKFRGAGVKAWNDKEIRPGLRWDKEIKDALANMDVFIPLVSVNFAVSDYISTVECRIAKKRHEDDEIDVVPVLVGHPGKGECAWLMALQRVPPGAKSWAEVLRDFQQHDLALTPIRDGIKEVVERALKQHKKRHQRLRAGAISPGATDTPTGRDMLRQG